MAVAMGDLNGDGRTDLATADSYDHSVSVLLGKGDGTFLPAQGFPTGDNPTSVAIGHLNEDGIPDLAVANAGEDTVSVLIGLGGGAFLWPVKYHAGDEVGPIAVEDLDGNETLDIVVVNKGSNNVSVLLGNGNGIFQVAVNYSVGEYPSSIATGDFDGDGNPDLAVTNPLSNDVSVLLGKGDGTFQPALNSPGGPLFRSITADFNGDGNLDLAATAFQFIMPSYVYILPGNGDGSFQEPLVYFISEGTDDLAAGDLDGDGAQDLVLTDPGWMRDAGKDIFVLLGNGDGTFQEAVNYSAGTEVKSVGLGDVDGDDVPDMVVTAKHSFAVSVLLGRGDGTFRIAPRYELVSTPGQITMGDLNGDGNPDLVTTHSIYGSSSVSVLLSNGDGTLQEAVEYAVGEHASSVSIGDLDANGVPDLAVTNGSHYIGDDDKISILMGNGDGTFQAPATYEIGGDPQKVVMGTLNADSYPDLAVANPHTDYVSILLGNGDGTFLEPAVYAVEYHPRDIILGNLDGDGFLDILVATLTGDVAVLLGSGEGAFQAAEYFEAGDQPTSIALGDLNEDGRLDAVTGNEYGDRISVLLGNGDGTLQAPVYYNPSPPLCYTASVALVDLDEDGHLDLTAAHPYLDGISVLWGLGDGTFGAVELYGSGTYARSLVAGNLNGDGRADLAVANGPGVSVLINARTERCHDNDGDGFGNPRSSECFYTLWDCDDTNPAIHPFAWEIPGNGVDDNCDGWGCFIATAAFGTAWEGKIDALRNFRDEVLLETDLGTSLVTAYYEYSPPLARFIAGRGWLRVLVRTLLLPVVGLVSLCM